MTQGGTGKEKAMINWVGKALNRLHADFMSQHRRDCSMMSLVVSGVQRCLLQLQEDTDWKQIPASVE